MRFEGHSCLPGVRGGQDIVSVVSQCKYDDFNIPPEGGGVHLPYRPPLDLRTFFLNPIECQGLYHV